MKTLPHVVVVGGGISGLAAAWYLTQGPNGPRATVTLLESSERFGGKLALQSFGGLSLDTGAEALLAARPEAVGLCKELGLETVPAATTQASIYSRGRLRAIPRGLLTGVPTDLRKLAASGILSLPGLLRIPLDHVLPRTVLHGDVSVGDYVSTRLGGEVTQRLVEPMLGGVYAGRAETLSLQMTVPALYRAATQRRSAIESAASVLSDGRKTMGPRKGPIFVGLEGGVGTLPGALVSALRDRGVVLHASCDVQQVRSRGHHWDVVAGDGRGRYETHTADAVLFATPAPVTGALLESLNRSAADELLHALVAEHVQRGAIGGDETPVLDQGDGLAGVLEQAAKALLALAQLLFHRPLFADVGPHRDDHLLCAQIDAVGADAYIDGVTVAMAVQAIEGGVAIALDGLEGGGDRGLVVARLDISDREPGKFLAAVAQTTVCRGVEVDKAAFRRIDQTDGVVGVVEDRPENQLAAQRDGGSTAARQHTAKTLGNGVDEAAFLGQEGAFLRGRTGPRIADHNFAAGGAIDVDRSRLTVEAHLEIAGGVTVLFPALRDDDARHGGFRILPARWQGSGHSEINIFPLNDVLSVNAHVN